MEELKTILGIGIPTDTRGILYLCEYTGKELIVKNEILFDSVYQAFEFYANIRNPESQLATGKTFDELIINLHKLHDNMVNPFWIEKLKELI